jgi:predicted RNA binding protein YcfA (HicA-like mRNA interferase family)
MRLPRDLSGDELIRRLAKLGYTPMRQSGSHVRLTATDHLGEHHVTIPRHDPLRIGTLAAIIGAIAERQGVARDELLRRLLA